MRYGSICSGVEAASLGWEVLGWKPVFFAEIDKYPSEVLKQVWPRVPNLGDFTTINENMWNRIDILVGGTPCQSFSMSGLRRGIEDERGNLSLQFIKFADRIDSVKQKNNKHIKWVVWENVPGVLSSKDNAFGHFLAGLSGRWSDPFTTKTGKWPKAGYIDGEKRNIAWRVLDASYFGVPQRRRRVFVIASPAAGGIHPKKVLLESEGESRHFKARHRQKGSLPYITNDWGARDTRGYLATLRAANPKVNILADGKNMRVLSPVEMERAMGMPDNHTRLLPEMPEHFTKRQKCCGNSMAVPVMRWIGDQIDAAEILY